MNKTPNKDDFSQYDQVICLNKHVTCFFLDENNLLYGWKY